MLKNNSLTAFAALLAVGLVGCGGGGGSAPVATPSSVNIATTFPLFAAYKNRINSGASDNFSVSGTCAGSASITTAAAATANFEGVAGFGAGTTISITFTNCTPASNVSTSTTYYDSSYAPLGSVTPNTEYARYQALPSPIPVNVKSGDTAILATLDTYTSSSKTTKTGQRVVSYLVEPDSTSSVFVIVIAKSFNTSNQLLFTQQTKYRLTGGGVLTVVGIDVQYSTTSDNRLIYTKI